MEGGVLVADGLGVLAGRGRRGRKRESGCDEEMRNN
jgi:hypothetical protein